jgi:hypothetical protein
MACKMGETYLFFILRWVQRDNITNGCCLHGFESKSVALPTVPTITRTFQLCWSVRITMHSCSYLITNGLIGVTVWFADPCGRSLAGIVGSYPTWGIELCPLWMFCVVR